MTLSLPVKKYFEEHIDALDRNDWMEFILNAYQDLKSEYFNQLLTELNELGDYSTRKFDERVEPAMRYIITRALEDFDEDEFQNDYISINTFLNSYLRSFFTLDIRDLEDYMIINRAEWSENFWDNHGLWSLKKRDAEHN